jgi:hydrogenase expression/formation protein
LADLEGMVRRGVQIGLSREEILGKLVDQIIFYKNISWDDAVKYAITVYDETLTSLKPCGEDYRDIFCTKEIGASAGSVGIGSRGSGDFLFHRLLINVARWGGDRDSSIEFDDAGWVRLGDLWIVAAVDGIHSRLSYFPLLAGFHAARAAARDVMVKGAFPILFTADLRIGDDGDPAYLLDLEAGVAAVSKYLGAPIVGGSTLRIGGDIVIGRRVVGTVMCVGISGRKPKARRDVKPGDLILMTKGAGGGTITTTAIYGGRPSIALKTINFNTLAALKEIVSSNLLEEIHAMFDVTNGGLRGDLNEISRVTGVGFIVDIEAVLGLVDSDVLSMLRELDIDPLGVSLDSIAVIAREDVIEEVRRMLKSKGVESNIIGRVIDQPRVLYRDRDGSEKPLEVLHRESPYTKIKKLVGVMTPDEWSKISAKLEEASKRAQALRDKLYEIALINTILAP